MTRRRWPGASRLTLSLQNKSHRICLYIWYDVGKCYCKATVRPNPNPRCIGLPALAAHCTAPSHPQLLWARARERLVGMAAADGEAGTPGRRSRGTCAGVLAELLRAAAKDRAVGGCETTHLGLGCIVVLQHHPVNLHQIY
jgi:hypothetical protein